jgi:hypothetical protein
MSAATALGYVLAERSELFDALTPCMAAIRRSPFVLGACALLTFAGERLAVQCSDGEYFVSRYLPVMGAGEWMTATPAAALAEVLEKMPNGEVRIEALPQGLKVSCGKSQFTLRVENPDTWPSFWPSGEPDPLFISAESLESLAGLRGGDLIGDVDGRAVVKDGPVTEASTLGAGIHVHAKEVAMYRALAPEGIDVDVYANVRVAETSRGRVVAPVEMAPAQVAPVEGELTAAHWTVPKSEVARALRIAHAYGSEHVKLSTEGDGLRVHSESALGVADTILGCVVEGNPPPFKADAKKLAGLVASCRGDVSIYSRSDAPTLIKDAARPEWTGQLDLLVAA